MICILDMKMHYYSGIIGHQQIIQTLQHAFTNKRIAHAYLFSGVKGIGKYKTAWAFARMLQCTCAAGGHEQRCQACRLTDEQEHPDIATIVPQGAGIRIEQIREIRKLIQYHPRIGNRKIFIIDGVDRLTDEAANSLLKILEEPPDYVLFILLTDNVHRVLPTILSRCQHLSFQPVAEEDIIEYLTVHDCTREQAAVIAAVSGGIPGRALLWSENGHQMRDQVFDCLEALKEAASGRIWDVVATLDQEKEAALITFELISFVLRDCMVWKATGKTELLLYKDCAGRIELLAEKAFVEKLLFVYKELAAARQMLLGNANSRLLWEKICLRMQDALGVQEEDR